MKVPPAVRTVVGVVVVMAALGSLTALAYFLTAWLYQRTGQPPLLAMQVINTLLGFFLFALFIFGVGRFFRPRQLDWFRPIIAAMEQMARGDFSVHLSDQMEANGAVGQLVRSVNKMAGDLGQLEQMRQAFISDVSHEIQSPLTSIRGFARALKDDDLAPAARRHYLDIIETESMRLSKLSDNLLELASLDSEQIKPNARPYRLDAQLRQLILASEPQWAAKGLDLDLDVALADAGITADEDLLSQVWVNLLHNSIKFTPAGGCVRVSLRPAGDRLEVQIADTGSGIAPEDQARIFERFYKGDKARRRSEGGSGLGLSIVKKILDMHHATIRVESQPGSGAVFTVSLPRRAP
ncbi:MAG: HAMP domain-containing sensor histidine kinase [Anaerolineales bacterium]